MASLGKGDTQLHCTEGEGTASLREGGREEGTASLREGGRAHSLTERGREGGRKDLP